jgi:hypothetical protein
MKRLLFVVGLLIVAALVFSVQGLPFPWSGETPAGTADVFWWLNQ